MNKYLKMAVVCAITSLLVACGKAEDKTDGQINSNSGITNNLGSSNNRADSIEKLDAGIFKRVATQYDNDLAVWAANMSDKSESESSVNIESYMAEYGLKDIRPVNYGDSSAFAIGHREIEIYGDEVELLVIVCRGSITFSEYVGDLFKGFLLQPVHDVLGYPVWDNVYDFEEQVWAGMEQYLLDYPEIFKANHLKVLITGHSLGGAAANVIGARLTDENRRGIKFADSMSQEDIYVYTFNAIKTVVVNGNIEDGYENIHNIYNYYDSFGPHGNLGASGASDPEQKFGHTDMYYVDAGESLTSSKNHMNYIDALNAYEVMCYYDSGNGDDVGGTAPTATPTLTPTLTPTPEPEIPIDWITLTDYFTDKNGYVLKVELKLSPWILLSNQEVINAAWRVVGKNRELPDMKYWNYKKYTGGTYGVGGYDKAGNHFGTVDGISDMYYSVGSMKLTNVTEGWDIDPNNPPKASFFLTGVIDKSMPMNFNNTFVSEVLYTSENRKFSTAVYFEPGMKTNSWGPVPFVIAHPENYVPAYPDGQYRERIATTVFGFSPSYSTILGGGFREQQTFCIPFWE